MVDDPAGGADHDLRAALEPGQLRAVGRAAVDRQHRRSCGSREAYRLNASACNANSRVGASTSAPGALTRRRSLDRIGIAKTAVFPVPVLGQADDVGSASMGRDGGRLDRGRHLVADIGDGLQHIRVNVQVGERRQGVVGKARSAGSAVVIGWQSLRRSGPRLPGRHPPGR